MASLLTDGQGAFLPNEKRTYSMNEDFAIEPTVFRDSRDLKYALEKFGFSQGRFLAAYPKRTWRKLVFEKISQFSDLERKRAEYLLGKYNDGRVQGCGLDYMQN